VLVPKSGTAAGNDYDQVLDKVATVAVSVKLIAMNDFHGNIEPPAASNGGTVFLPDSSKPGGSTATVGGAAYLSTLIKNLKAKNPNNIVVGAGDMIGASPFTSNITHEEAAVDILNQVGLEVTSVGNHEFDKGKAELLRMQSGGCFPASGNQGVVGQDTCLLAGKFPGASFKYLSANVTDTATGKTLFAATHIKQFGLVSVGFIGLTLQGTPAVVTASGVAGLRFDEESAIINKYAADLKANGVTAVVVLIHQGGQTTATTLNDQTCPGFTGDILPIMDKLSANVDAVVSGHTHQEYVCTYKGKLLTSTGFYGGAVSEIDLTLTPGKGVKAATARTVPVLADSNTYLPAGFTSVAKDATIDAAVLKYTTLSSSLKNLVVGTITASINRALLTGTTNRDETAEGAMGDVLGDVYLAGGPAADIGIINPGGVRADLTYTGSGAVTYGALLTVAPFGNSLVTLDLTGAQLVRLLEQQWEVPNNTAKTGINGGGRMLQMSKGLTYTWDAAIPSGAAAGTGARIVSGTLKLNGVAIDPAKVYKVTTNSFLADGGDNFTVMATGKNRVNSGVIDIDGFVTYMRNNSPLAPPAPRITRLH
jgi:5'-nucleotidase